MNTDKFEQFCRHFVAKVLLQVAWNEQRDSHKFSHDMIDNFIAYAVEHKIITPQEALEVRFKIDTQH